MYPMKRRMSGSVIRKLRKDRNLTLQGLSKICDVSYQAISDIERGMWPTKEAAWKLATALEFSPLEWTWNLMLVRDNLRELGADDDQIVEFLKQLEVDEWIDLQRW